VIKRRRAPTAPELFKSTVSSSLKNGKAYFVLKWVRMEVENVKKSETAEREEKVLQFWKENKIFEKTLEKPSPNGEFVFYDGPPFATGLPHSGSLLPSVVKDVIPRYKTMQGFHVRRRWGWDCHGLPIENMIEKQLSLKAKKDIESIGIEKFNETARKAVLKYTDEWEKYIERIGRWVEFKNAYKTMDNSYIESVWWGLKKIYDDGRLYEGRKVLLYCTHCETPLSKAEIAMDNSYKDVIEESVTVKFKVKNPEKLPLTKQNSANVYLLAWTTTPWTLPGNVALAVGNEIMYAVVKESEDYFVVAKELLEMNKLSKESVVGELKGKDLVGIEYEPLFKIEKVENADKAKTHTVLSADFVTTEDGTGIVHTAVIYGEDDYQLGLKEDLSMVPLLDASGKYNSDAPAFLQGKYIKGAEKAIKEDLDKRGLLFARNNHTHSYPHCYRCGEPLIYNALTSWFIDIQSVKKRMLELNEEVNWVPAHLKHGRFGNILESAPDWTISRNRYWASPLPIWKSNDGKVMLIGSIEEMRAKTKKSGNRYVLMRHGEALSNVKGFVNREIDANNVLTERGMEQARSVCEDFKDKDIQCIYTSPLPRTQQTAEIVAEILCVPKENIIVDKRLLENGVGEFEGKSIDEYHSFFSRPAEKMLKVPSGGENWHDSKQRMTEFLYSLEKKHENTTILIISHGGPLNMLCAGANGYSDSEAGQAIEDGRFDFKNAEVRELDFVPLPHNASYELDLHRPYADSIVLVDEAGEEYRRIPEVVDCWVESASMPFAEYHYPFENKENFEKRFPGDFISEYIAQTRTWFYYMHAMGALLFDENAFKNVATTGTILASDGSKMSKSKGNYTDPLENIDQFGADAFRHYLMTSVVMQAEDFNFRDEELREAHNRVVNILWNTCKFYVLYKADYSGKVSAQESPHVLDRWVLSRLGEVVAEVTKYLDAYDTVRTGRTIRDFVEDFSTWYVRRSRDRVKQDGEDKQYALSTMRHVLLEFSKVIAPFMPFIAESIYKEVESERESVHLEEWPQGREINPELLKKMTEVRSIVSLALEARAGAGIKVRQPLQTLRVKSDIVKDAEDGFLQLIKDEMNVKEVVQDGSFEGEVLLDTEISEELKEEGMVRELVRKIQDLRKKKGLLPGDVATLTISTNKGGKIFIEKYAEVIKQSATLKDVVHEENDGDKVVIEGMEFVLRLL
jgi:isoleucyl-tRNA synthetase